MDRRGPFIPVLLGIAILCAPRNSRAQSSTPALGAESAPLALLREAERETEPGAGTVAEAVARAGGTLPEGLDRDLAARIQMPQISVRITPRIAHALALYRSNPRARRALASWLRHGERYRARIESALAAEGVPVELVWVVAAESDFNPNDVSRVGAAGLWQLMPETARSYGLRVDAWVDERKDPDRATHAAARLLRDLHARFGAWDLALAAYNMGYNALLHAIRKYNTNDFERIASLEAGLPFETVQYVPRILSMAIAARNASLFGITALAYDPVRAWEDVLVSRSVPMDILARGLAIAPESLRALNPALVRTRTPPADEAHPFVLHVPPGMRSRAALVVGQTALPAARLVRVRHGELLDEIAARYGATTPQVLALSGLARDARVLQGTELFVPDREPSAAAPPAERPMVAIDAPAHAPQDLRRVFYRVGNDDTLTDVARALGVARSDLVTWNALDESARLQSGMWLQAFVRGDSGDARVWGTDEVELVRRESDEFHDRAVARDGRVRVHVIVRAGDSMDSIAEHYGLSVGSLARINRRSRHAALRAGETVVVYAEPGTAE